MAWKTGLAYITASVDQKLLLRNEELQYLTARDHADAALASTSWQEQPMAPAATPARQCQERQPPQLSPAHPVPSSP